MCNKATAFAILALLLPVLAGCGSRGLQTAEVTGTVTLDGKPLSQGSVIFIPLKGRSASGVVQPDGRFTLSTYQPGKGDGAIVGMHKVAILCEEEVPEENPSRGLDAKMLRPPTRSLIPQRYNNVDTSGLTFEVEAERKNEVCLELFSK